MSIHDYTKDMPYYYDQPEGFRMLVVQQVMSGSQEIGVPLSEIEAAVGFAPGDLGRYNFGPDFDLAGPKTFVDWPDGLWSEMNGVVRGYEDSWCWVPGDITLGPEWNGKLKLDDQLYYVAAEDEEPPPPPPPAEEPPPPPPDYQDDPDISWRLQQGPVGDGATEVKAGDCLSSLSNEAGLFWEAVWNHDLNADLRSYRRHPNILLPGDKIEIAEKESKVASSSSDRTVRFLRKDVPILVRLRFTRFGKPRKDEDYELLLDGRTVAKGKLDADGQLVGKLQAVPKEAVVYLGVRRRCHRFKLGHLPPVSEICGVKARLLNLNYYSGAVDDDVDDAYNQAVSRFIKYNCGGDSDKFFAELVKRHGS